MSSIDTLKALLSKASTEEPTETVETQEVKEVVAPAGVILAHTVQKVREGEQFTTYELASVVKRLAYSELEEAEIARRFTKAFEDVLIKND